MMRNAAWFVIGLLLSAGVGPALAFDSSAHTAQADSGGDESWHEHRYTSELPTLIPAGHISPAGGLVVLGARDDLWWGVMNELPHSQLVIGGLICQVPAGGLPCPPLPPAQEPDNLVFCHGVSLRDGENWHSDMDTYVYTGGYDQLGQTPGAGVWCENAKPATTGVITHWPGH